MRLTLVMSAQKTLVTAGQLADLSSRLSSEGSAPSLLKESLLSWRRREGDMGG